MTNQGQQKDTPLGTHPTDRNNSCSRWVKKIQLKTISYPAWNLTCHPSHFFLMFPTRAVLNDCYLQMVYIMSGQHWPTPIKGAEVNFSLSHLL